MSGRRVFISCVTSEFGSHRAELKKWLARRAIPRVQEDLPVGGHGLLVKLDEEIRTCDAVVHVLGRDVGEQATREGVKELQRLRPDFVERLPHLAPVFAEGGPTMGYTFWEAWLAIYHRVPCHVFRDRSWDASAPNVAPEPGPSITPRQHLEWFRDLSKDRGTFGDERDLALEVVTSLPELLPRVIDGMPIRLPLDSLRAAFVGRKREVRQLFESLHAGNCDASLIQPNEVIHGLGGQGKTRLAVEYAWRFADQYSALLSVVASSPADLTRGLAALCADVAPEVTATEEPVRAEAVLRWLEQPREQPWLLILDNVDTDETAVAVQALLPRLHRGHVLITSRRTAWGKNVHPLPLGVLSEAAGVELVLGTTPSRSKSATDEADARALVGDLGGLALALEQASAYIEAHGVSVQAYREKWQRADARVRAWFDPSVSQYPRSVMTTWETTVERLSPGGRALLEMLSWLSPDPLPEALFERADWNGALRQLSGDDTAEVESTLAELRRHSLVGASSETARGSRGEMHRLLQLVTRERQKLERAKATLGAVLAVMNEAIPNDPPPWDVRSWAMWEPLRPHVEQVVGRDGAESFEGTTTRLLGMLGGFFEARALFREAEPLKRRALAIAESSYGPEHPTVARALSNLASLLHATNRLSEAESLMRRALAIAESSYGPEHPEVATDLNNLAQLLQDKNRLSEAEPLLRRALAIDESSYGPEHPEVATDLNNLAQLLQATNRLSEAEPLMRRALAIDESSYGPEHPTVATRFNNLAQLLKATNRLSEAEPLLRRALAIDESSYGPEHPTVAIRLNNLASLLHATNRLSEAEPLMRRALAIAESSYGPEHPTVAIRLSNLASLHKATNRLSEAEPLMRRALVIDESSYGPEHPEVATDLNNIASLLYATNRLPEAEPLARRSAYILALTSARVGHELPNLPAVLENYRRILAALGHPPAAIHRSVQQLVADAAAAAKREGSP